MKYGSHIIEKKEYVYLKRLLNISGYDHTVAHKLALKKLALKLDDSIIVDEEEMPADIVRLNSKLTIKSVSNSSTMPLQIVIPMDEEIRKQKLSVLSPLPVALIGYSEGDQVDLAFTNENTTAYVIQKVEQDIETNKIDIPI
ncbi:GreA/GreB family elongation factor [Mesonia maritima]|uniref:Regulator of nucleoside diphosphate kinase n=1 Tax=Mesonia maritima TaxID=1793873 RepID=A0ABU1K5T5_9FLAO|nr:GreA/GreB family elongation factor [Mesonia maritima]MDR6300978.1 regulator of nucleoside diphosphate kinase [Mesonia maritima]